ncbi:Helix-turn-helix domain-containing protein [Paenibacillus sp. UNCCL117]|uniref:helix-turn-helix domain-containing protein n=1 Tax=unclassified Paenibacillus TaxID=185978 RepID=UPI00089212C5|nr:MULTISPECIES: helix-turn-helix domain-containing protein [unclassified Paenibacillus]SDD07339.1 Helix-turn-helix domain-containing protein [Paenibacillus sp. cl123]SFW31494.1 Helix-turn-helix domain-containing protein [Paenibacillus sp. UNCCL117]
MFTKVKSFALFGKIKRRRFFIRLILTIALIAVIPNLLSDVVAYYKVSRTFEEETGKNKLQYLNQTINSMEIVLNRIKENSNLLAMNQGFQDFEKFPSGSYYEGLQGEILKEDLFDLYWYLENKKNALSTLNSFKMSNEFVNSVYFYDSSKDLVFTSENDGSNRQFTLDAFYDTGWVEEMKESSENPVYMDTRIAKQYHPGDKSLLTIIYRSTKASNAFIINLDAGMIHKNLLSKLNEQDDIFVASAEGSVLFHSQPARMHQPLQELLPGDKPIVGETGAFRTKLDDKQMLISYSTSSLLNWTFINTSDMEALSEGTSSITQTIILSAVLLLALSVTLAYLSSRSLYRPISYLHTWIHSKMDRRTEEGDELHSIGRFVQSTLHERDYYKEKLEESLPFYKEKFKYTLLHRHSMTMEEIEERKAYLGLEIDNVDLALLLLSLDDRDELPAERDMMAGELLMMKVIDTIKESGVMAAPYFLVDAGKDTIAIVLNRTGPDRQQLFRLGQRLLDVVNQTLGIACTIGAGRACATILQLPQAFEEAQEALKYRIIYGKGDVISIEDLMLASDGSSEFVYPKQKEELLLGHIKMARGAEALQAFEDIVAELSSYKHKLHYNQIQPIFVQLLTGIMNACAQLGASTRTVFGSGTDPYRELLEQGSLDQISKWFHRMIQLTTANLQLEMHAKGNTHITRVVDILEREYDQDISLNSVAEQLNLNPAYISRLFKQITGQPFVDYLKRIRIEKSKELLIQSDMKINEIGKRVGYSNSYYFIKVFKELMGLTPGEYKKIYGS